MLKNENKNDELRLAVHGGEMDKLRNMAPDFVRQNAGTYVYNLAANAEVVQFLADCGVKPFVFPGGRTPLFDCGADKVESLVAAGYDVNARDESDESVLGNAVRSNRSTDVEKVLKLLACGALVNAVGKKGETSLFAARTPQMTETLLAAGANPNAAVESGYTPIFFVHHVEQVDLLVQAGAKVDVRAKNGESPLFSVKTPELVKALLDAGVDVNAQDENGETVLFKVARTVVNPTKYAENDYRMLGIKERYELWRLLLSYVPDLDHRNNEQQTVWDVLKDKSLMQESLDFYQVHAEKRRQEEQYANTIIESCATNDPKMLQFLFAVAGLAEMNGQCCRYGMRKIITFARSKGWVSPTMMPEQKENY